MNTVPDSSTPNAGESPAAPESSAGAQQRKQQTRVGIILAIVILLIVAGLVAAVVWLAQPSTPTSTIRDIFIIFMALESLLIGLTLVILIIQLARLINLLQNEIKPILDSTNESVNTLRGTAIFLSNNLTEPVMKINEYVAALRQLGDFLRFSRKKDKKE